jgi:cyanophycin synthetase
MNVDIKELYLGPNLKTQVASVEYTVKIKHNLVDINRSFVDQRLLKILPELEIESPALSTLTNEKMTPETIFFRIIKALYLHIDKPLTHSSYRSINRDEFSITLSYDNIDLSISAVNVARNITLFLFGKLDLLPSDFRPLNAIHNFLNVFYKTGAGLLGEILLDKANELNIPYYRLDLNHNIIQLGQGNKQQRIQSSIPGNDPHLSTVISKDKLATSQLLSQLSIPVPLYQRATRWEEVIAFTKENGFPVVVKPAFGTQGNGITTNINSIDELKTAYQIAKSKHEQLIIEEFLPGEDHRLLVINGKFIAAARREPAQITGNGTSTIQQLIAEENNNPIRNLATRKGLFKISVDDGLVIHIQKLGYTLSSVLERDKTIRVTGVANLSKGGSIYNMSKSIHPDNIFLAERVARALGHSAAGIDLISTDISQSYRDNNAKVCEANSNPGLEANWIDSPENKKKITTAYMDMLFPNGGNGRIPTAAITGTNGKTTTAQMLSHCLQAVGDNVGMTTTNGIYINKHPIFEGDCAAARAAHLLFKDPLIDIAVLETARGGIINQGLAYEKCDVAAVLNISEDHLGKDNINNLEEMAAVKALVAQSATQMLILNADDHLCRAMANTSHAKRICFISEEPENTFIKQHINNNDCAIIVENRSQNGNIILYDKGQKITAIPISSIPATLGGKALHNASNAAAALALAYGLNKPIKEVALALTKFECDFSSTPGRCNIYTGNDFTTLMDYAHNPEGMKALLKTADNIPNINRRICVFKGSDSSSPEMIDQMCKIMSQRFDHYFIDFIDNHEEKHNQNPREFQEAHYQGLIKYKTEQDKISIVKNEKDAVDRALEMANKGDLVVICADNIKRTWKQITEYEK